MEMKIKMTFAELCQGLPEDPWPLAVARSGTLPLPMPLPTSFPDSLMEEFATFLNYATWKQLKLANICESPSKQKAFM